MRHLLFVIRPMLLLLYIIRLNNYYCYAYNVDIILHYGDLAKSLSHAQFACMIIVLFLLYTLCPKNM